ncbi:MAG TPA: hypothetical protein VJN43_05540 [Bryobacteraceae bacterium]|nr:hypothetical protein [Bryobacteraceae bacterium]
MRFLILLLPLVCCAASVPVDLSGVKAGPVAVESSGSALVVTWPDDTSRTWRAEFSLDPERPLITSIAVENKAVIERARPLYWCSTGIRRGGWDQFFDFPPSHPQGTRRFIGEFHLAYAAARTIGDRVEVEFGKMQMGIFEGTLVYTFYPGGRLIRQEARLATHVPDTAYFYAAGIRMADAADTHAGGNTTVDISYYSTDGQLRTERARGPELVPAAVRYRTLALRTPPGSIAVFPPPHQYFFARDFTSNLGYLWSSAFRGSVSIGIRQLPDDNSSFYPWMNAPPGTEQRMGVFFLLSDGATRDTLDEVLRYTHADRFPALEGFKVATSHWHFAYTEQALEKGFDWTPPFKPVLESMGVDAAVIADFHGDGHPRDLSDLRLKELEAYFRSCRAQSDARFLLIPSEEANVHLGGHWALIFPKPVYWFMNRPAGAEFVTKDAHYGNVYRVANAHELVEMVRRESGYMYQTHPRTKGSTGYPDAIRETEQFRDPRYVGAGWKAMPSDLSSPRLGERAFKLLDDMSNWGMRKRLIGEVDVFQLDSTDELYAHMNVNYVRLNRLPDFDHFGEMVDALTRGDGFMTTGEVLLPEVEISGTPDVIHVHAGVGWTFPLEFAEIVWGDGSHTFRETIPLASTRAFGHSVFQWKTEARNWKWSRVAVWDIAGDGAFTNPVWK